MGTCLELTRMSMAQCGMLPPRGAGVAAGEAGEAGEAEEAGCTPSAAAAPAGRSAGREVQGEGGGVAAAAGGGPPS